jgi:putative ABC transport system ATP-binding protein
MLIKADHLRKVYKMGTIKVEALKEASFQISEGEFVAIIGPSGSGIFWVVWTSLRRANIC